MPKFKIHELFNGLKLLPTITFALMLGAGMVMTGFAAWYTIILAYGKWTVTVEEARVNHLGMGMLISLGLIGLIIVVLAFGKIKNLSLTTPAGVGGTVEFDDDDDNSQTVTTTTETKIG